jgi:4,5-dihydroxyphthalate decarboxylase
LLKPVNITPNTSAKSLSDMLADGDIDAVLGSRMPDSVRTHPDKVAHLFPDFREEEKRYYRQYGIHPIMHLVVIRKQVYERNPWVAQSLFKAFVAAKDWAVEMMRFSGAQRYMLPWLFDDLRELDEVFGDDPWPYGIDKNRATLTTFVTYMHQQGFIAKELAIEELFVPMLGRVD